MFLANSNEFIVLVCLLMFFNLDSVGLSLATCEFLVFSGVNFKTSGLIIRADKYLSCNDSTFEIRGLKTSFC